MKFDILYPNQPMTLDTPDIMFEGSPVWKYGELKPCWHCGEFTSWIDISFEAHLCSEECERAKWKEFEIAFNRTGAASMTKYLLKDKKAVNQEPEPYEDLDHLIARLYDIPIENFMLIIADRLLKPNIIMDFNYDGKNFHLNAFEDDTMKTLYQDAIPTGNDLDGIIALIKEMEVK